MAFLGIFGKKKEAEEIPSESPGIDSDETGLGRFGSGELGIEGIEEQEQPYLSQPQFNPQNPRAQFNQQNQRAQPHQQSSGYEQQTDKDYQILSAKLDALKAILDSINYRLENLERISKSENEKKYF